MRLCRCLAILGWILSGCLCLAQNGPVLRLEKEIVLPKVEGRIDHLSVDLQGQRVFVSALGNDTVEVVEGRVRNPPLWATSH